MALIACRECGSQISTQAAACPKCGAALKAKPMGCLVKTLIVIVAIVAIGVVIGDLAPKSPAKSETQAVDDKREGERVLKIVTAGVAIKRALRDPDSVVWETMRSNDDASLICIEYRARNGFGGMNRDFAVFLNGVPTSKETAWNKNCLQPLRQSASAPDLIKRATR